MMILNKSLLMLSIVKGILFESRAVDSLSSIHFVTKRVILVRATIKEKTHVRMRFLCLKSKESKQIAQIVFSFVKFIAMYSFSASLSRIIEKTYFCMLKIHSVLSPCQTNFPLLKLTRHLFSSDNFCMYDFLTYIHIT